MSDISLQAMQLLATALSIEASDIDSSTMLGTTYWDSLAHMRLILLLEETLGYELGPEMIVSIFRLSDIEAILNDAQIS